MDAFQGGLPMRPQVKNNTVRSLFSCSLIFLQLQNKFYHFFKSILERFKLFKKCPLTEE